MWQRIEWQIGSTASILEVPQASQGVSHMVAVVYRAGMGSMVAQLQLLGGIIG